VMPVALLRSWSLGIVPMTWRLIGVLMMLLVGLTMMIAAMGVVMRRSAIVMMIRDFGMNVKVWPLITMVAMPDRALCRGGSGVDPQTIGHARGTKSFLPALASGDNPLHRRSLKRPSRPHRGAWVPEMAALGAARLHAADFKNERQAITSRSVS
jgi:hypothetical protein